MILSYRDTIQLINPAPVIIIQQPTQIDNVFTITPEEHICQTYECDQRVCGCGPVYTVTLTNARIIERFQDYMCCCKGDYVDSMLFLSDISSIHSSGRGVNYRPCTCSCTLCYLVLCWPLEFLCCLCRCFCSNDIPIPVILNGPFGKEVFTFSHRTVLSALGEIPAAAMPHKTSSRIFNNQPR